MAPHARRGPRRSGPPISLPEVYADRADTLIAAWAAVPRLTGPANLGTVAGVAVDDAALAKGSTGPARLNAVRRRQAPAVRRDRGPAGCRRTGNRRPPRWRNVWSGKRLRACSCGDDNACLSEGETSCRTVTCPVTGCRMATGGIEPLGILARTLVRSLRGVFSGAFRGTFPGTFPGFSPRMSLGINLEPCFET